jgi:endo-1,4-beta-xylanase
MFPQGRLICLLWCGIITLSGTFFPGFTAISPLLVNSTDSAINVIRKRDCSIMVLDGTGKPISNIQVSVKQIRHHFGFGAAIPFSILHDEQMKKVFLDHYEWAVFENELKWPSTDPTENGPNYSKVDSLLDFCNQNDIKVRAHCLFWNQKQEWLPGWTLGLNTTDFNAAVDRRIQSAMTHCKGRVEHWDAANEVIHGTQFETRTGNQNIWNYILDKARGEDSLVKLTINDFNIIERYSDIDKYIAKINSLRNPPNGIPKAPIDIIGLEGHFGDYLVQSEYKQKIDKIADVGLPLWLTEFDCTVDKSIRADKFEELLRTAFATPKMEGFMMWVFWGGNRWDLKITSYIADSANYAINDLGKRYESLMNQWTTIDSGFTSTDGKYSFRGFQGKYLVTTSVNGVQKTDTIYLEPGQGIKSISITNLTTGVANTHSPGLMIPAIQIVGTRFILKNAGRENSGLFVSMYSTSGKRLARLPLYKNYETTLPDAPAGFYVYRIENEKGILYTAQSIYSGR